MTPEIVHDWRTIAGQVAQGAEVPRDVLKQAVKDSLAELQALVPGRSVEVRIPPFAAVQVIEGTTHRRGTPSAVVEADPHTWLLVASGRLAWADAVRTGRIRASGERSDLSSVLPLGGPRVDSQRFVQ